MGRAKNSEIHWPFPLSKLHFSRQRIFGRIVTYGIFRANPPNPSKTKQNRINSQS